MSSGKIWSGKRGRGADLRPISFFSLYFPISKRITISVFKCCKANKIFQCPGDKVHTPELALGGPAEPVAGASRLWSPDFWVSTTAEPIHLSHPKDPGSPLSLGLWLFGGKTLPSLSRGPSGLRSWAFWPVLSLSRPKRWKPFHVTLLAPGRACCVPQLVAPGGAPESCFLSLTLLLLGLELSTSPVRLCSAQSSRLAHSCLPLCGCPTAVHPAS